MTKIRVGVVDVHEVFRLGIVASLAEDPHLTAIELSEHATRFVDAADIDVLVMSSAATPANSMTCPRVVCYATPSDASRFEGRADVYALLPRGTVTPEQLSLAVRAAAAGLRINNEVPAQSKPITDRAREVLRLLAGGAGTREIAGALGYSERTIKSVIADIQVLLGTRNRTHAVAEAVRADLI